MRPASPHPAWIAALLILFPIHLSAAQQSRAPETTVTRILDFDAGPAGRWYVVNDGVMGGRSSSTIRESGEGTAVFVGDLSLENNGGFASVRTEIPRQALAGSIAIRFRVLGDGHRYQLRLRPGGRFDGVAFAADFETEAGEWVTVELPIDGFRPTYRGYQPRGVPPLDPADVGQLGFMLTDKQEGAFRLEIAWMEAVSSSGGG